MTNAADIDVTLLDDTNASSQRWDEFVLATPGASFFHLSGWKSVLESVLGHRTRYLVAEREGRILGVLPLAQIRSLIFGNSLISLPFGVYGGYVGEPEALLPMEQRAEEIARELDVEHLEFRNRCERHSDWPRQELYATFRREIFADDDTNMKAIPRKQRAMVRKGIKNGLVSEIDANVDRFYALYSRNVRRHGTPGLSRRYFSELKRRFGESCEVLTVVDSGGRPVSSVLSFYFRDEILPYYAGDDAAARQLAANDFKYWELMRRARERGCRLFDYGRSKIGTGSWHFKKNWGFEPEPLHYEHRLYKLSSVPQKNPLNPKYRWLIATWRHLPLALTNRLGPLIARQLG